MEGIPRPRFTVKPIDPLTREEIEQLLQACKYSRVVQTSNRRPFKMLRKTYRRDRAFILFLLGTGVRASELCTLQVGDADMSTGEVTIRHGKAGGAKGAQGRSSPVDNWAL
jgi:integrase/recombinase XerD